MIKFAAASQRNVSNFLSRYLAWTKFQQFSSPHEPVAQETHGGDPDAVRVYSRFEKDSIQADPRRVVAIDLKEGLKELDSVKTQLPQDKHYIVFSGSHPGPEFSTDFDCTLICYDSILFETMNLQLSSTSPYFYDNRSYAFDYPKPLIFECFIGTPRPYRTEFADWLPQLGYSNFIFRLDKKDYGVPANDVDFVDFSKVTGDLAQWFEKSAQHTDIPHHHVMGRIPVTMMNQAYFDLVLESDFDLPTMHVTEKTLRPLLLGMPFVVAGSWKYLEYVHSMGFRTYGELWDESYDQESDHHQRLKKVFELCQRLGRFDWAAHTNQLQEIGQHNRANFINLSGHYDRIFRKFESIIKDHERRY